MSDKQTPQKFVYDFTEGNKDLKDLLGGKGANLAEMTNLGLPVPPGFTITTEACKVYLETGEEPAAALDRVLRVVKVVGFVASAPSFTGQAGVVNGASELLGSLFGEPGHRHRLALVEVRACPCGICRPRPGRHRAGRLSRHRTLA